MLYQCLSTNNKHEYVCYMWRVNLKLLPHSLLHSLFLIPYTKYKNIKEYSIQIIANNDK
jgi:hypothetical protein